jgi:hypothetical protein
MHLDWARANRRSLRRGRWILRQSGRPIRHAGGARADADELCGVQTARALGLEVPNALQLLGDEVIE